MNRRRGVGLALAAGHRLGRRAGGRLVRAEHAEDDLQRDHRRDGAAPRQPAREQLAEYDVADRRAEARGESTHAHSTLYYMGLLSLLWSLWVYLGEQNFR